MKLFLLMMVATMVASVQASWYWPFGKDDAEEVKRLSTLMEPASLLIDEAADLASDGKVQESVEKYRAALTELDKVEQEHPDRVQSPEFATLRNKRAYVSAAIDTLLLSEVRDNARPVAVSDTAELEKKLQREQAEKRQAAQKAWREETIRAIAAGQYEAANDLIEAELAECPDSVAALNLRAALEIARGQLDLAERALEQAISTHPGNFRSYYNMTRLLLNCDPVDLRSARGYYEAGLSLGGKPDAKLEAQLKARSEGESR